MLYITQIGIKGIQNIFIPPTIQNALKLFLIKVDMVQRLFGYQCPSKHFFMDELSL